MCLRKAAVSIRLRLLRKVSSWKMERLKSLVHQTAAKQRESWKSWKWGRLGRAIVSVAPLHLLDTAKPELLGGEEAQGCSSEGEHVGYHKHLATCSLLLMGKARSVSHTQALQRLLWWARPVWSVQLYLLLRTGSRPYKRSDRQLGCATKEAPLALFYMLK